MKYLVITDIPTPWREPVFERVNRQLAEESLHVVYFKNNEKRRLWHVPFGKHPKTILPAITYTIGGGERFFNPGIIPFLFKHRPRVAVIFACIKDPTALLAMIICRMLRTKIILLDDSWLGRDRGINWIQRMARHVVYSWFGDAFVGSSKQTLSMFAHYNRHLRKEQLFLSHLVADNEYFQKHLSGKNVDRRYDVLFSGRIVSKKNPIFFAEVCGRVKERLGKCSVLILGEGEESLKAQMREIFEKQGVTYHFAGFIQHEALPNYYAQAKVLLLPTSGDCWGVVINEAMLAGTPVITTEWTAAAGELVLDGTNGFVLPLESRLWADKIEALLNDPEKLAAFSECAKRTVAPFCFENAAHGILASIHYLEKREHSFVDRAQLKGRHQTV